MHATKRHLPADGRHASRSHNQDVHAILVGIIHNRLAHVVANFNHHIVLDLLQKWIQVLLQLHHLVELVLVDFFFALPICEDCWKIQAVRTIGSTNARCRSPRLQDMDNYVLSFSPMSVNFSTKEAMTRVSFSLKSPRVRSSARREQLDPSYATMYFIVIIIKKQKIKFQQIKNI